LIDKETVKNVMEKEVKMPRSVVLVKVLVWLTKSSNLLLVSSLKQEATVAIVKVKEPSMKKEISAKLARVTKSRRKPKLSKSPSNLVPLMNALLASVVKETKSYILFYSEKILIISI